jgi:lysophospholipase L1-like esterase
MNMHRKRMLSGSNKNRFGLVLFGDSITLENATHPTGCGFWNWANALLGQRLDVIANSGVGGESTTQMLTRIQPDVLSKDAGWVLVEGGANDIAADASADTIYSNLVAIYNKCFSNGQRVIGTTILPSSVFNTTQRTATWLDVNNRLRIYAADQPAEKFVLSDIGPLYRDTGSAYAVPLAGYTISDQVHPNALGAGTIGQKMYADLKNIIPVRDILIPNNSDPRLIWFNAVPNPLMTGTDGTKSAPATGTVAHFYTATGGGTWSQIAHGSGVGNWQKAVLGAESDTLTLSMIGDATTGFAVGDNIAAMLELDSDDDWVGAFNINLYLACLNASSSVLKFEYALGYSAGGGSGAAIVNPRYAILRTANVIIPANTTKIRSYWQFQAVSGTVRISRFCVFKVP